MDAKEDRIEAIRAALAPHGIFLRGVVHFEGNGPEMADGDRAGTIILLGNVGGSIWPAFRRWRDGPGQGVANPLATFLSAAMMLRHGLGRADDAARIDAAVDAVLERGLRTPDLVAEGETAIGTEAATEAVLAELSA